MSFKKLSNNKYKISVELGYDILGNRKRKTEITGKYNRKALADGWIEQARRRKECSIYY